MSDKTATKEKTIKHLVLDTGAIIANSNLHNLAEFFYAPSDVPREIRSAKARKIWETLPYEVVIREPSSRALKAVVDASKKTGDFQSLSIADIKVIALTYDLQQQFGESKQQTSEAPETDDAENEKVLDELSEKMKKVEVNEKPNKEDGENDDSAVGAEEEGSDEEDAEDEEDDESSSDDEGWITQDNIDAALKKLGGFEVEEGLTVGCITTDFALQNVLLSMNLGLVSLSGYRIRKIKSFVLRCRACFNTTTIMTKEFCSQCGHKMLHKCAVSVDENGEQQLHINWNRLGNRRGMIYSLSNPKGGKHAINERLFEDQPMPQMRLAKVSADPLADGPFAVHDVNSRSAMLGIRTMSNKAKVSRNRNEAKRGGRRK